MKRILAALVLLVLASVAHSHLGEINRSPLAMVRVVESVGKCVENKVVYGNMTLDCSTPLSYFDLRKLDMRSAHRAARKGNSAKWVTAKK